MINYLWKKAIFIGSTSLLMFSLTACGNTSVVEEQTETQQEVSDIYETSEEEKEETSVAVETDSAITEETNMIDVSQTFNTGVGEVNIRFQMPESWGYTSWDAEAESPDWGYVVSVQSIDDARISIFGQYGTLSATGLYANEPESFVTSNGMSGELYVDEVTADNGEKLIDGMLVFEYESYGVSFNMPKEIYDEEKDNITELFKSIVITE